MIKEFQGDYRWLSNFAPVRIWFEGRNFATVEHAYMSAKSNDEQWKITCALSFKPGEIKRLSRNITLVENWDILKLDVMFQCLVQKYNQEPYKSKLIATRTQHIQEGNNWGDKFWGVDLKTGKGENNLGKFIMRIREDLLR